MAKRPEVPSKTPSDLGAIFTNVRLEYNNTVSKFRLESDKKGLKFSVNPELWNGCSNTEKQVILRKMAGHILLGHTSRSKDKDPMIWNLASSALVNYPDLHEELDFVLRRYKNEVSPTPPRLGLPEYLSDEINYYLLEQGMENAQLAPGMPDPDTEFIDGSDGESMIWESQARKKFDDAGGDLNKLLGKDVHAGRNIKPETLNGFNYQGTPDWLKQLMSKLEPQMYYERGRSWRRENRQQNPLLPGRSSHLKVNKYNLAFVVDTSGSMMSELNHAFSAVKSLLELYKLDGYLVFADEDIREVHKFSDLAKVPEDWTGGGGTHFDPVFEKLAGLDVEQVVFFTDGFTSSWGHEFCKTIWVLTADHSVQPPFGDVLYVK